MNKILKVVLIVLGVLVVAGGAVFGGFWWGRMRAGRAAGGPVVVGQMPLQGPGSGRNTPGFGPGPMNRGFGPGFMDRGNFGPRNGFGPGGAAANVQPVTADVATQAAQKYVDGLGISGLKLDAPIIIGNDAYVAVKEDASGIGAFELLVDPMSKTAHPAGGADVLWNLKYGAVAGANMKNGAAAPVATPAAVTADMPVTVDQAVKAAQAYLDQYQKGATAGSTPTQFYGYYTVQFSRDGKVAGLLSVNGFNSEIFPGFGGRH